MKRSSAAFLQFVTVVVGIVQLVFLLWEPTIEGVNVGKSLTQIYLQPFILIAYFASLFSFFALYQAFRLWGYAGAGQIFSVPAVKAMRIIKYCAAILVGFVLCFEAYLFLIVRGSDDSAGGVFIGLIMLFVFGTACSVASMFERSLQKAVDIQSENDLTV